MSWHYLQEGAEESLRECFSVVLASELVKSRNISGEFFWLGKKTDSCRSFQSGTTSGHSAATTPSVQSFSTTCEQSETGFQLRRDFRVRTFRQRVKALAFLAKEAGCGVKHGESLMRYDRRMRSWKTHRCLFPEVLTLSSVTFAKWGMTVDGEYWELTTLERPIVEKEYGSAQRWVTPNARDWKDTPGMKRVRKDGRSKVDQLPRQVYARTWPTPRTKGMCGGTGNFQQMQRLVASGVLTEREKKSMTAGNGGTLNPTFPEWLMMWPIGWTELKPLEMDKFQSWPQQHGSY